MKVRYSAVLLLLLPSAASWDTTCAQQFSPPVPLSPSPAKNTTGVLPDSPTTIQPLREGSLITDSPDPSSTTVVPAAALLEGQTEPSAESTAVATVTQVEIDAKTKEVNEATDLDEASKKEALERLKNATEWLKTAKEAAEKAPTYQAEIVSAPNELVEAKRLLALPRQEPQFPLAVDTNLTKIEQIAAEVDAKLKLAKETLTKREESLKRRSQRKPELTKIIPETEKAFEEAKKALKTARDRSSLLDTTRRLEAEAKFLALEQQRTLFPLESRRIDALAELATLNRDLAKRDVEFTEKESSGWQRILVDARKRDSDRQAEKARRQLHDAAPALKSLAERNSELAEQRKKIVALMEATALETQKARADAEDIKGDYSKMAERVEKAGNSTTIGLLLRRQRDELPNLRTSRDRLEIISAETPKISLAVLDLQDEEELLDDRESVVAEVLAGRDETKRQYDDAYLTQMAEELLTSKGELIATLIRDHEEYIKLLGELEVAQIELIDSTQQSQAFIDERVLWIRSSEPIGSHHFSQAWEELQELAKPGQWIALAMAIKNRIVQQPFVAMLSVLVVILMMFCRDRFRRQVNLICETDPAVLQGSFMPTVEAVFAAALASAFWPGIMWLAGWQLQIMDGIPELGVAVGLGLQSAAFAFWLCRFARQLCRRGGIAERHFQWDSDSVKIARRSLSWLSAIGIPCVFFITAVTSYRDGDWSSFLGRIGFLLGVATLAVFAHTTLHARSGMLSGPCSQSSDGWLCRLRYVAYFAGVGAPLCLALLAALGYDYSAQHLALRLQSTLSVVLAVILARAIALRWLDVRRFRLQEATRLSADEPPADQTLAADENLEAAPATPESDEYADLRHLLRYAVFAALFAGGYFVWSDVAPALSVLDQFEISSKLVEVKQNVTNLDGTTDVLTTQEEVKTTLKHAVLACLLLAFGLLVARNLPTLVDALLLEHMPIDKGQRYAAGLILRYILTLTAVVMACLTIGLSWSSIQWLAAAMTVGLGFGLQEIFANLVSGLIILFERPVRIGDLVTVSGVSGRVTRMQIRATTITDFERRELIVPNKKFITEEVMNWTLTDDVNRLLIEVGVAYGSDTERVRHLLLKVAREHPLTLDDPEPLATFDKFSDSSLNFTLRCFLPNLEHRLDVIHELHSAIDREFRAANIEIAFPQQDLHVRSIETPLGQMLTGQPDQKSQSDPRGQKGAA